MVLPRVYVILDAAQLGLPEIESAKLLVDAGVRLIQYRNKSASARKLFEHSRELGAFLNPAGVRFVVNDRADVAALAGADGVHVGQDDLGPDQARRVLGERKWVGTSTHNEAQFRAALKSSADYLAIGPIFGTSSKENPDPTVGLELLQRMTMLSDKPIVAIGGITLERAAQVIEAGADSVAVISDIWRSDNPGNRAREYIELLESNSMSDAGRKGSHG